MLLDPSSDNPSELGTDCYLMGFSNDGVHLVPLIAGGMLYVGERDWNGSDVSGNISYRSLDRSERFNSVIITDDLIEKYIL